MSKKQFQLQPFSLDKSLVDCQLIVNTTYDNNYLTVEYQIFGDWQKIKIPSLNNYPTRQDNLWQHTCFEFFVGIKNSPIYYEFNLSPSGDWNIYRFTDYRQGMTTENAFTSLPFEYLEKSDHLLLRITLDINQIIPPSNNIDIAITTVIEDEQDYITYWALKHTGKEADFHRRDSFISL